MGFGILFAGYMFLFSIPLHSMGVCADIIGYVLMLRAFLLLKPYQRDYGRAAVVTAILLPFGAYSVFLQILGWFGADTLAEKLNTMLSLPYSIGLSVLLLLLHWFLLRATVAQAKEVGLSEIAAEAKRNRIVTVFAFALMIAANFANVPAITDIMPYQTLVGWISLFDFVWMFLTAKMIFHCYMWICLPGDEDMPMRPSKLPSIFHVEKPVELTEEEQRAKARADYNEAMRRRQEERTKKNKRHKDRK